MHFGLTLIGVSGAFLNAYLGQREKFAVEVPSEFKGSGKDKVWLLRKALVGLRGAPRDWQGHLVAWLNQQGFERVTGGASEYVMRESGIFA